MNAEHQYSMLKIASMEGKSFDQHHLYRWLTAAVVLPVLVIIIALGQSWLVLTIVLLVTAVGLVESFGLLLSQASNWLKVITLVMGLLLPLASFLQGSLGLTAATVAALFVTFFLHLAFFTKREPVLQSVGAVVLTLLYVPFALSHIVLLLELPAGRRWIFLVLVVIFAGDTGAYYAGHKWGRYKLYPTVSPGKTIEGAVAGLLSSLVLAVLSGVILLASTDVGLGFLLSLGLALSVVGQVGDLIASMLKRLSRVKDTSGLLPGHGGLLDRLDSLLFAFPATYYAVVFFI